MRKKPRDILHLCAFALMLMTFVGCSGSSGGSDTGQTPQATPISNWEEMSWDQDNWG